VNIRTFLFTLPSLLVISLCVTAQPKRPLAQARPDVERLIAASGAETVGVAVYDLQTRQTLFVNERASLHAASTMKVPVMMELFRQAGRGQLDLDAPLTVKNNFSSIVDGSPYRLSRDDDSDAELYGRVGGAVSARELIRRMITRSSNLATNILIERAGAANVMKLMRELGARDIQVRRGVEDTKAFRAGLNNTATAYDLMLLFRAIAERKFLGPRACDEMLEILAAQEFNEGVPAGVPAGTRVAHKTGSITKIYHDAAIVYPPARKPYVIVVLTRGLADEKLSHRLVADISRRVYQALAAPAPTPDADAPDRSRRGAARH
jgi:beta-lactamase class A